MGLPSPTMILVALNCVSPLIDAEAVLQPGGRRQPGPHLDPGPARMPCLTPGSQGHQGERGWAGVGPLHLKQEPGKERPTLCLWRDQKEKGLVQDHTQLGENPGLEISPSEQLVPSTSLRQFSMVKGHEGKCSRERNAVAANSDPVTSKRHSGGTSLA